MVAMLRSVEWGVRVRPPAFLSCWRHRQRQPWAAVPASRHAAYTPLCRITVRKACKTLCGHTATERGKRAGLEVSRRHHHGGSSAEVENSSTTVCVCNSLGGFEKKVKNPAETTCPSRDHQPFVVCVVVVVVVGGGKRSKKKRQ